MVVISDSDTGHFSSSEEGGAILHLWEFLHGYFYHIVLLLLFSLLNLSNGLVRLLGRRTNPSLILAASFLVIILIGAGLLMLPRCTVDGVTLSWVDATVYFYQCRMCNRAGTC